MKLSCCAAAGLWVSTTAGCFLPPEGEDTDIATTGPATDGSVSTGGPSMNSTGLASTSTSGQEGSNSAETGTSSADRSSSAGDAGMDADVVWTAVHPAPHDDSAAGIGVSSDGVYVCGTQDANNEAGVRTGVVIKYDFDGEPLWGVSPIDGEESFCRGLVVGSDGDPVIAGVAWTSQWEAHTIRLDGADGSEVWGRTYLGGSDERFYGMGIGEDDDVVSVGSTFIGGQTDLLVQRFGPDGTERWVATRDVSVFDTAWGAALSSDGDVYVAGTADDDTGTLWGVLVRLHGESGELDWIDMQNQGGTIDELADVVVDGDDGTAIVVGQDRETGVITLRKHDLSGGVVWSQIYAGGLGTGDLRGSQGGLAIDSNEIVYFAGTANRDTSDVWVRAFDTDTGAELWTMALGALGGEDYGRDLIVGIDGLYVVGEVGAGKSQDIGTFFVTP